MLNKEKESNLQTKVLNDIRSLGRNVVAFKIMKASDNGIPDIFFTTQQTGAVFIEMKRKGDKPRPLQDHQIKKINRCGSKAYWCDSIERWLEIKEEIGLNNKEKEGAR